MFSTYEIRTEAGYHVVRVGGELIARVMQSKPLSSTTDPWQVAFEVCAGAGLPKPKWVTHANDVIYIGFTDESRPA